MRNLQPARDTPHPLLQAILRPHDDAERLAVFATLNDAVKSGRELEVRFDSDGRIIDGRLTKAFCVSRGVRWKSVVVPDADVVETILSRNFGRSLSPEERLRGLVDASPEVAKLPPGQRCGQKTREFIAQLSGVYGERTVQKMVSARNVAPEVFSKLGRGLGLSDVDRISKLDAAPRKAALKRVEAGTKPSSAWEQSRDEVVLADCVQLSKLAGSYDVVLADPPWSYNNGAPTKRGAATRHYPTMPLAEIKALASEVNRLASVRSVLLLWVPAPLLDLGIEVLKAWSFTYYGEAIWLKEGAPGMGGVFRVCHESLLIGVRIGVLPVKDHGISSVISAARGKHSEKPVEFYEAIERLWPSARKVELFARAARAGWDRWGAEAPADFCRGAHE